MKKYIVAGVEVSLLGQKITLNGIDVDNKPITKIAHVSRFRPILKAGAEFVMYNYREDEQTMVAQSYTANGKIYIDIPSGCTEHDQRVLYEMLSMDDAVLFRRNLMRALNARKMVPTLNHYKDLQNLIEMQSKEAALWAHLK